MKVSQFLVFLGCVFGLVFVTGCLSQKPDVDYVGTENVEVVGQLRQLFDKDFRQACDDESDMPYWVGSTRLKCTEAPGQKVCRSVILDQEEKSDQDLALAKVLGKRDALRRQVSLDLEQEDNLPGEIEGLLNKLWLCNTKRTPTIRFSYGFAE